MENCDLLAGPVGEVAEKGNVVVNMIGKQLPEVVIVNGLHVAEVEIVGLPDGHTVGQERHVLGVTVEALQLVDVQTVGHDEG